MSASIFMRLSSLVTVRDLLDSLDAPIPVNATLRESLDRIDRFGGLYGSHASLVMDGESPVGWTDYWSVRFQLEEGPRDEIEDRNAEGVRSVMLPLRPDRLVTADTSARRAIALLTAHPDGETWFVLDGNEIVGTLLYDCLFKPEFRVCLFALAVELEQVSMRLCLRDASASWGCLSPGRQDNAKRTMILREQRRGSDHAEERVDQLATDPSSLLECTTFIDKKVILTKRQLVPGVTKRELGEVFDSLEHIRNRCAHPDDMDEPFVEKPHDLLRQVTACHKVLQIIEEQLQPTPPAEPEVGR